MTRPAFMVKDSREWSPEECETWKEWFAGLSKEEADSEAEHWFVGGIDS